MGCYNLTCGISNLPILSGDPVVGFVLAANSDKSNANSYCYINDSFSPISLPFYGLYDEYGSIENIDLGYKEHLFKSSFRLDPNEDVKEWIKESLSHGSATVKIPSWLSANRGYTNVSAGLWLCHRDIFESFKSLTYSRWGGHDEDYKQTNEEVIKQDAKYVLEDYLANPELYQKVSSTGSIKFLSASGFESAIGRIKNFEGEKYSINLFLHSLGFGSYASNSFLTEDYFGVYREYLVNCLIDGIDITPLIDDVAGYYCLVQAMKDLRKGWSPQTGAGSQQQEYHAHIKLMQVMTSIIKKEEALQIENTTRYDKDGLTVLEPGKGFKW